MPAAKKTRMIVREIKPKIKIIEPENKEQSVEVQQETGETPLEDIITDAPSSREFPALSSEQPRGSVRERGSETPTPAATTTAESSSGAKYGIQQDVTEAEIRKVYQSRAVSPRQTGADQANPQIQVPGLRDTRDMLKNREVEALRTEQADERYSIDIEPKAQSQRRKLPWEA